MDSKRQPAAIIWDMDGVIVDSAQVHFRAWRSIFHSRNVGFTYEDFRHTFGQRNDNIITTILGKKVAPELVATIAREKEERFRSLVEEELEPFPGAIELIQSLNRAKFPLALASSAPMQNIELILDKLGLKKCFPVIVSSEEVSKGKPDPEIFLTAAKRLNVEPGDCLVIEDAVAGVTAAKAAGMKCIAVTNTHTARSLIEADLIADSLREINIDAIKALWKEQKR
jgi:beta-phosphoglucomutase family hydrolase